MDIEKYDEDELRQFMTATIGDVEPAEWDKRIVAGYRLMLKKEPMRYRGFGPYWPLIKKAMIDAGEGSFGEHIDTEVFQATTYGDANLDVYVAFGYESQRADLGLQLSNEHALADADGESFLFTIIDDEMEGLSLSSSR